MNYEILNASGEVVNTIVADWAFVEANFPGQWRAAPEPEVQPSEPTHEYRHITVGAFFDRFGAQKWAILSSTEPMVQALVKDASVRKFIDLDRPDLIDALQALVAMGFAIDPSAVLNAPVADVERV